MAARAKFEKGTKASRMRKILSTFTPEQLNTKGFARAALESAGIKFGPSELTDARKRVEKERGGSNGTVESGHSVLDTLSEIPVVLRIAKRVGGINRLKDLITLIERVKEAN